jgi:hypothetical protein
MSMDKTFDLHLASDVMSVGLEERLRELGFIKDAFIGGTTGVVHPCHYSNRPASHTQFIENWKTVINVLSNVSANEFYGYAEAEVTLAKYRVPLDWKPFVPSIPFPFGQLQHEECPPSKYKHFDIHITVDLASIDHNLKRLLEERIAFNYVDIRKPSGSRVRVYTFQPLGIKETPVLFNLLVKYFQKAGGLEGKIKLEATHAFARFPSTAPVPPIITRMPPIRSIEVVRR